MRITRKGFEQNISIVWELLPHNSEREHWARVCQLISGFNLLADYSFEVDLLRDDVEFLREIAGLRYDMAWGFSS